MILVFYIELRVYLNLEKWFDKLVEVYDVEGKIIEDLVYVFYLLEDVKF